MKVVCLSICFISVLFIGEVCSDWWNEEEPLDDLSEIDLVEEDPSEDYPPYYNPLNFGDRGNVNTEENEVETGGERLKPDLESTPGEDGQPGSESRPDLVKTALDNLAERFENLLSDFKAQQEKVSKLEEANRRLVLKIDSIEQQVKTNSIILTNVRQDTNESSKTTLQRVLHVFNRIMRVPTSARDIAVALRAESNSAGENQPIVVRFTTFAAKMRVLAASKRLSSTEMTVSSDYSELVAQRRAALLPFLEQARAGGSRAYILYDRLVVDGVRMTLEELRAREEAEKETGEPGEEVDMLKVDCTM